MSKVDDATPVSRLDTEAAVGDVPQPAYVIPYYRPFHGVVLMSERVRLALLIVLLILLTLFLILSIGLLVKHLVDG